ncbi:MAG: hypothetical protein LBJ88_00635 [Campylobacteraceae bacterium]|jgi:hypothetical protein|nr:hypothetical protein [Campylobacteraceae bacterium]
MLLDNIKCFGKKAIIKTQNIFKDMDESGMPKSSGTIDSSFLSSVGKKISNAFSRAKNNKKEKFKEVLFEVDEQNAKMIKNNLAMDIEGSAHVVNSDDLLHIENRHGENSADKNPITNEDMLKYGDIVYSPGKIAKTKTREGFDAIMYQKKIDDAFYVVEVVRKGKKELAIKTMYKTKSGGKDVNLFNGKPLEWTDIKNKQVMNADDISSPHLTPKTFLPILILYSNQNNKVKIPSLKPAGKIK